MKIGIIPGPRASEEHKKQVEAFTMQVSSSAEFWLQVARRTSGLIASQYASRASSIVSSLLTPTWVSKTLYHVEIDSTGL